MQVSDVDVLPRQKHMPTGVSVLSHFLRPEVTPYRNIPPRAPDMPIEPDDFVRDKRIIDRTVPLDGDLRG